MLVIDYFDDLELSACRRINSLSRWKLVRSFFAVEEDGTVNRDAIGKSKGAKDEL